MDQHIKAGLFFFPFSFQVVHQFTNIHQQMADTLAQKYGVRF